MAKKPTFWSSFSQTYGPSYETAKEDGANEYEATLTGIINSFAGSAVEVGGGIETIPNNPISVKNWIKGAIEEGNEEVVQGVVENLTQKFVYDKDKEWLSLENDNAVINPTRSLQEFVGGASVGALLGGAQIGVMKAIDNSQQNSLSDQPKDAGEESLVDETLHPDSTDKVWELAQEIANKQKNGESVNNYELGSLNDYATEQSQDTISYESQDKTDSNFIDNKSFSSKIELNSDTYLDTQNRLVDLGVDESQAEIQAKAIERLKLGDTSDTATIIDSPQAKQILAKDTGVVFGTTTEQGKQAALQVAEQAKSEIAAQNVSIPQPVATNHPSSVPVAVTQEEIRTPKAVWKESQNPIQINAIDSVKNGELYVTVENESGKSIVKASDLIYQNPEVELIYQTAAQLDTNGAKAFVYGYKPNTDFNSYYKGFMRMYDQGISNMPFGQSVSVYASMLSPVDAQRAYYAGVNDRNSRFTTGEKSSTIQTRDVEDIQYTYEVTDTENLSENSKAIQTELEKLGLTGEIINKAPTAMQNGKSIDSKGDSTTLKDGHILIRNDTTLNPKNVAGHEAFHAWKTQGVPEAEAFLNTVNDNIDFSSSNFQTFFNEIQDYYFSSEIDFDEILGSDKFQNEFSAYASGVLYEQNTGEINSFSSMFYDWDSVQRSWNQMMEAIKRRKQNGRSNEENDRGHASLFREESKEYKGTDAGTKSQTTSRMAGISQTVKGRTAATNKAKTEKRRKSGLVLDRNSRKLTGGERVYLDALAKISGTSVIVEESILDGSANGYFDSENGEIHIALDATDQAYHFVMNHELTHRLQQQSPKLYQEYFDYVVTYLNQTDSETFDRLVQKQIDGYKEQGRNITRQVAMDEVVADASDAFLKDSSAIVELVNQNKTLGQKILESIRSFINQLNQYLKNHQKLNTEAARMLKQDVTALKKAERLWLNALLDSNKNTVQQSGTGDSTNIIKKIYSINPGFIKAYDTWDKQKTGFQFYIGTTSKALRSIGVDDKSIYWDSSKIKKIKKKHPQMTDSVIKQVPNILENPVLIMESQTKPGRLTLFGNIYDANENPVLAVLELNPEDHQKHSLDIIKIASAYGKDVNVQSFINNSRIKYVEPNKKRTNSWLSVNRLQLPLPSSSIDSSTTNIPQDNTDVNNSISKNAKNDTENKFSLKNVSNLDYDSLAKENKKLKEVNALLKEQFKITQGIKWDKASIKKVGDNILNQYNSTYDKEDLYENLTKLYEYIANSPDVNADEVHSVTTAMAKSILEHSEKLDNETYLEYKPMRDLIRATRLTISQKDRMDLDSVGGYVAFRRNNFGRIQLVNDGIPIDSFYQELSNQYPEFFSEDITHPADQLMHISDVLDTIKPQYLNPYGMNIDEYSGVLASEILERYFDVPQAKPTFADKELQKRNDLKLQYQKKLREIKVEYREKYEEKLKAVHRKHILEMQQLRKELKQASLHDKRRIQSLQQQIKKLEKHSNTPSYVRSIAMSTSSSDHISVNPDKIKETKKIAPKMQSQNQKYNQLNETYGSIPKGEHPVRDIDVPSQTAEDKNVRRFARTAMESNATPDELVSEFEKEIVNGTFSYEPIQDKVAQREADLIISKNGFDSAMTRWQGVLSNGTKASKNDIVLAEKLYMQAAKDGNHKLAMQLAAEIAEEATRSGQNVQAMRLLKKMSGEGQLVYVERVVDRMNQDLTKRRMKGKAPYLEVSNDLAENLLKSKTKEEIDSAVEDIYKDLSKQLPATFVDKWNAWRYFAMLGNPRTHIRNITGNAVFYPAVRMKNLIATGIESIYQTSGGNIERTKTIKADKKYIDFAKKDFDIIADSITSGGKYNPEDIIRENQRIFKLIPLEKLRKLNFDLLELEDKWFLRKYYVSALSGYLSANHVEVDSFSSLQIMERARNYAIQEAKKATYRDSSAVANMIQRISNTNKATSLLVEGVLPFKKTPVNILKRGVEYSPAGLLFTLTAGTKRVKSGQITAAEYIDGISAGLTGSALLALGAFLTSLGFLRGGEDKEKKKEKFEQNFGVQPYSLQIGDVSYTIDWMAPVSLPLFVGAEMYNTIVEEQDSYSVSDFVEDLQLIAEPVLNLSMLSGLNDTLSSVQFGNNAISDVLGATITGYFGQAVPTLFGQIARTADDTRRITYPDKNVEIPTDMQYFLQKNMNKIPGASMLSQPYIDLWGNEEKQESILIRALQNFVSPGYIDNVEISNVEHEISKLYELTGDKLVFPSTAPKYFTVNGARKDLTAKEYTELSKEKGQKALSLLTELLQSPTYQYLSPQEKVDMIEDVYEYATVYAKTRISDYEADGWKQKAIEALENGQSEIEIILTRKSQ